MLTKMSHFGWAVFDQLVVAGMVHDGDCVCKSGRNELIALKLAERKTCPGCGGVVTILTRSGRMLGVNKVQYGGTA